MQREHTDRVLVGRAAGDQGERPGVRAQVMAVLYDEVPEGVVVETAVGQSGDERRLDDLVVHGGSAASPRLAGKRHPNSLAVDWHRPYPQDVTSLSDVGHLCLTL